MCCGGGAQASVDDLIQDVYGGLPDVEPGQRAVHIIERAILTPLNEHVDAINMQMMDWMSTFDGDAD